MAQSVDWAIKRAFLHANRKTTMPVGAKYDALLAIADSVQKMWAAEPDIEWDSLYSLENIGTVTATDTFDLPDEINYLSKSEDDPIRIGTNSFKLVKPNQLYRYKGTDVCAQVGKTLKFANTFASDSPLLGEDINVPSILAVEDITSGSDEVQVDDPMWLVYMMAAEFDRNDIIKVSQYDNLLALADQSMQRMKQANSGSIDEILMTWQPAGEDWN